MAAPLEVHVTAAPETEPARLQAWAERVGGKVLTIDLEAADATTAAHVTQAVQPMVTFYATATSAPFVALRAEVAAMASEFGVHVTRLKLETSPDTNGLYVETHVLLRGPRTLLAPAHPELARVAAQHGARWSRNARRTVNSLPAFPEAGPLIERFLTRRDRRPPQEAKADADAWLAELKATIARFPDLSISKYREESVVWDSAEIIDEGWA